MQPLSPSEQRILAFAWKNISPRRPKIDYAAVAAQAGYKNARSAQSVFIVARKKLLSATVDHPSSPTTTTTTPRRARKAGNSLPRPTDGTEPSEVAEAEPAPLLPPNPGAVARRKRPADEDGADEGPAAGSGKRARGASPLISSAGSGRGERSAAEIESAAGAGGGLAETGVTPAAAVAAGVVKSEAADSVAEMMGCGEDSDPALLEEALEFLRGFGPRALGEREEWADGGSL